MTANYIEVIGKV